MFRPVLSIIQEIIRVVAKESLPSQQACGWVFSWHTYLLPMSLCHVREIISDVFFTPNTTYSTGQNIHKSFKALSAWVFVIIV